MSLYRKYRPQIIEDLDLEPVRKSLYSISRSLNNVPQALLFSGPRGTGKTSSARIVAKLVNCEQPVEVKTESGVFYEPCNNCNACKLINAGGNIDVVEIDAASNRGIDDIRSLRETIALAPSTSKYKVYILDEAHMLTTEAANAFLKTLEEPPTHAIFILATTEPEKLPETIHSRLTKVNFRKANEKEILRQLKRVSEKENLKVDNETLKVIAKNSDGSFRDAVKILESLTIQFDSLTKESVLSVLENSQKINYSEFMQLVFSKHSKPVMEAIFKYSEEGGSIKDLIERMTKDLREILLSKSGLSIETIENSLNKSETLKLINLLISARENIKKTHIQSLALEIALSEWCIDTGEEKQEKQTQKKTEKKDIQKLDELSWARILSSVREKNASVEALLRAAKPIGVEGDIFNLGVYYRFHKERLETAELKKTLEEVVEEVLGGPLKIVCCLKEKSPTSIEEHVGLSVQTGLTQSQDKDIISAAKEIFS